MINEILKEVRSLMQKEGVDYLLISSSDDHASEYVGDYFKVSQWISGCSSDNVRILITDQDAMLWTDGRYFISAAKELAGSEYILMRSGDKGVLSLEQTLDQMLSQGELLAFDGKSFSAAEGAGFRRIAKTHGAICRNDFAPAKSLWRDRPQRSAKPVMILEEDLAGESVSDKVSRLRTQMQKLGAREHVISKLDDIMWLLNLRGRDIACNPVALSYLWISQDRMRLFLQQCQWTPELIEYCEKQKIELADYEECFPWLGEHWHNIAQSERAEGWLLLDPKASSDAILSLASVHPTALRLESNPTSLMKAVKNPTEMENSRRVYLADSVAICRFLYYVKQEAEKGDLTEESAADYLEELRREIDGYLEPSFETISAYNSNAAMAHYAYEKGQSAGIRPEGFLLVDSGGQYLGGTTDVTRTIALGKLTPQMKEDFTLVAMANLRLLFAKFLPGTSGMVLDGIAREPLWAHGKDYKHGTGHGIGYMLNVHEGPQVIRYVGRTKEDWTPFMPGMITSDEPGIYIEGSYGIRTESITLCVEDARSKGEFLTFEPLTFAPIDLDAINPSLMEASDIDKLNRYHAMVWEKISPFLQGEERDWLAEATHAI